ncbi:signal peptide peptidase SppA [Flavobacterium amnicola]|uniref:Signal peptide peptidase SppA n=1 Tax=Flavobacterium amnicola TaxID=2506422 RepID=A0A4Q1K6Z1_9FLAO|nr:signal peptide peptidase SppA [Flavobacterium amnicola]RXR21235.1 signal peptide peptidase SppA [Flavobacterium amnicola]
MNFLKNVLATIVGLFLFCVLFFFGIIILGALFGGDDKTVVKDNSVLELNLEKVTNDYGGKYNYEDMPFLNEKGTGEGLSDVLKAIDAAASDEKIKGISILNTTLNLGVAQTKALRDELEKFKKSGKFVLAYGNVISQKEYYLNSVATKVYLNPVGELDFKGLSTEVMYFKDFQDKTGLKMEVIRHGKYKSAVEPFLASEMSPENREQITTFLNSIWNSIVVDIAKSRNIPVEKLNAIATDLLARTPEMAKANKLVDVVAYEDVYHNDIKKLLDIEKEEEYNTVDIMDYSRDIAIDSEFSTKDKIAVIYAQGEIGSGEGDLNVVGEGSMRRALKEAREDEEVKAIVLRVDSPGGSALTSDLIWREIEITKKTKPVVVSMGNLAASGGYYISCNANKIFAENSTITGSIGVFGMLPNLSQITSKYGINTELVETHKNASGYSPFEPLDADFRNFTQEGVESIYKTFVTRVATGRKMTFAQVDAIAQGRVWAGSDALKLGLVDAIGGMDDALAYAASLVKLEEYDTVAYPEFKMDFFEKFENSGFLSFMKSRETLLKEELGEENYQMIQQIKKLNSKRGVQASLPFELEIK